MNYPGTHAIDADPKYKRRQSVAAVISTAVGAAALVAGLLLSSSSRSPECRLTGASVEVDGTAPAGEDFGTIYGIANSTGNPRLADGSRRFDPQDVTAQYVQLVEGPDDVLQIVVQPRQLLPAISCE